MKLQRFTFVFKIVAKFYRLVFKEELTPEATIFLNRLSYVTLGSGLAALITFIFTVSGGRILGPDEFGKFSLLNSTAGFLQIPMNLGFMSALVKFASDKDQHDQQVSIISTSVIFVIIFTVISTILCLLFSKEVAKLISLPLDLFYFCVGLAALATLYSVSINILRGLKKLNTFAILQPVYASLIIIAFIFFICNHLLSFQAMLLSMYIAYGVTGVFIIVFIVRRYIKFTLDRYWSSMLIKYALFALITEISSVFYTNIGIILINRYMSVSDVGIYNAYYSPSINMANILFITFNVVFFPTISRLENKSIIFTKIDKMIPFLFIIGTPGIFLFEILILNLFGKEYPINLPLMLIFAVTAVFMICYYLYAWTFNAEGLRGVKLASIGIFFIAIVDIILCIILIPPFGLYGAATSICIGFLVGICCLYLLRGRLTKDRQLEK